MPHAPHIRIIVLLFLCVATILFFTFSERYAVSGPELLKNPQFETGLNQWQHSGAGISALTDEPGTVVLSSQDPATLAHVTQSISAPQHFHLLRFSADLKTLNVKKGDANWKVARLLLVSFDASGKAHYYQPHTLIGKYGDNDWGHYEKVFHVGEDVTELKVSAQLTNATGSMWVKNTSLRPAIERKEFSHIRMALLALWLLTLAWVAIPIARRIACSRSSLIAALIVLCIAIGALLSGSIKEYVDHALPFALYPIEHAPPPHKSPGSLTSGDIHAFPAVNIYKPGHFALFTALSVTIFLGAFRDIPLLRRVAYLLMFAMITEVLQFFVEGRDARFFDLLLDLGGIMTGAAASKLFLITRKKRGGTA